MKEIADHTQMAASVLSSLYSSVLPTFIGEVKKGIAEEEALDYALSQVNNVSKKRLLGNLEDMKPGSTFRRERDRTFQYQRCWFRGGFFQYRYCSSV